MQVPQQNSDECGIYVLYFIQSLLQNENIAEVLGNKRLDEDFGKLVCHVFPPSDPFRTLQVIN
jgi:Ulp1 family protease